MEFSNEIPSCLRSTFGMNLFMIYCNLCLQFLQISKESIILTNVDVCPKNKTEADNASDRLNCSTDKYGTSQYMCVPNKEKTSLEEFCYDGVMELENNGSCLEVSEEKLNRHNCSGFSHGCPDAPFTYDNAYKYPACQEINTHLHCYVLDPSCSTQKITEQHGSYSTSTVKNTPTDITEGIHSSSESIFVSTPHAPKTDMNNNQIVFVVIVVMVVAVLLFVIIWYCRRKKMRKKAKFNTAILSPEEEKYSVSGSETDKHERNRAQDGERSNLIDRKEKRQNENEDLDDGDINLTDRKEKRQNEDLDDGRNWAQDCTDFTTDSEEIGEHQHGAEEKECDDYDNTVSTDACQANEMESDDIHTDSTNARQANEKESGYDHKDRKDSSDTRKAKERSTEHAKRTHTFDGFQSVVSYPSLEEATHLSNATACTQSGCSPNTRGSREQAKRTHTFDGNQSVVSFSSLRDANNLANTVDATNLPINADATNLPINAEQTNLPNTAGSREQAERTHTFDGNQSVVSIRSPREAENLVNTADQTHLPNTAGPREQTERTHTFDGNQSVVSFSSLREAANLVNTDELTNLPNTAGTREQAERTHTFDGNQSMVSFSSLREAANLANTAEPTNLTNATGSREQAKRTHTFDGNQSVVSFTRSRDSQPPKRNNQSANGLQ